MRRTLVVTVALLATSAALIPTALCAKPPPKGAPDVWPEEEYIPMPPYEAWPSMRCITAFHHDPEVEVAANEPFFLNCRWYVLPMNIAWDAETGEPVTPWESIAGRTETGAAMASYTVTVDGGEPLKPTDRYTGTCKWVRFWNEPNGPWCVAPLFKLHEWYYVFPLGLESGTSIDIHIELTLAGIPDFLWTDDVTISAAAA